MLPGKKTCGNTSSQSTKSRGGVQFLPLDCRRKARLKILFFTDTGSDAQKPMQQTEEPTTGIPALRDDARCAWHVA